MCRSGEGDGFCSENFCGSNGCKARRRPEACGGFRKPRRVRQTAHNDRPAPRGEGISPGGVFDRPALAGKCAADRQASARWQLSVRGCLAKRPGSDDDERYRAGCNRCRYAQLLTGLSTARVCDDSVRGVGPSRFVRTPRCNSARSSPGGFTAQWRRYI